MDYRAQVAQMVAPPPMAFDRLLWRIKHVTIPLQGIENLYSISLEEPHHMLTSVHCCGSLHNDVIYSGVCVKPGWREIKLRYDSFHIQHLYRQNAPTTVTRFHPVLHTCSLTLSGVPEWMCHHNKWIYQGRLSALKLNKGPSNISFVNMPTCMQTNNNMMDLSSPLNFWQMAISHQLVSLHVAKLMTTYWQI